STTGAMAGLQIMGAILIIGVLSIALIAVGLLTVAVAGMQLNELQGGTPEDAETLVMHAAQRLLCGGLYIMAPYFQGDEGG
ncbi:MAG: hypothetical protein AAFY03_10005, partial [Pseudomonadota bacterium]